ncbi:MAG: DUF5681 domain-containing protein [Pseudomonadota bacterium]
MSEDYEVGYGRPPQHTQFKPGQSGNPKGRPKRSKTITALLKEELEAKIAVTEKGVSKTLTKREAIVRQVVNGGLKGKPTDALRLLQKLETLVPTEVEPETDEPGGYRITYVRAHDGKPFNPTDEEIEFLAQRRKEKSKAKKQTKQKDEEDMNFLN